jgi:hypothetical protein
MCGSTRAGGRICALAFSARAFQHTRYRVCCLAERAWMPAAAVPKEFPPPPVLTLARQPWREWRGDSATHAAVTTLLSATPETIMPNAWPPACAQKASFQRPFVWGLWTPTVWREGRREKSARAQMTRESLVARCAEIDG